MSMPPVVTPAALLPAMSTAWSLVRLCPAPSLVTACLSGQDATPERLSEHVYVTVIAPLYQPAAFGLGFEAVIDGAVRSILIPFTDADVKLPALSETLTGPAPRFAPSPATTLF